MKIIPHEVIHCLVEDVFDKEVEHWVNESKDSNGFSILDDDRELHLVELPLNMTRNDDDLLGDDVDDVGDDVDDDDDVAFEMELNVRVD